VLPSDDSKGGPGVCVGFSWYDASVYGGSTLCLLKSGSNVAFDEVRDSGVVALAAIKVRYYREGK
jgi:methyl coenzyme M reductase beta subunit